MFDWKQHEPADCNVGLRLPANVVGLDIDQYGQKTGWDHLMRAKAEQGLSHLPTTWRSSARPDLSGIYLFTIPEGAQLLRGEAVPDVETVQHHHRYAVVWPSIHPTGAPYRWWHGGSPRESVPRLDELPPLPGDWLRFLTHGAPAATAANLPAPVEHRETVWAAAVGAELAAARSLLITAAPGSRHEMARDRCMALCRMEQNGLAGATAALDELGAVFVDAVRNERGSPAEAGAEWARMVAGGRQLARSTLTQAQVAREDAQAAQAALLPPQGPELAESAPEGALSLDPCASALVDWPEFWRSDGPQIDFLCEPFLARGRGHAMYATAKLGKSLILLEAAAALASGRGCWLHEPTEPQDVVYLDLEMTAEDVRERLADFGYDETSDLSRLHYYLLPTLPPLDTEAGGATIELIARLRKPSLVVIDTMGRVVDGDENDASTYQDFYRHTGIRLKRLGITYIRLDHAGKDMTKGQRGSSAKADDVDVVWRAKPNGSAFRFTATHRRMGWVSETVDIERQTNPLRHVPTVTKQSTHVVLIASQLDQLGAPLDVTQRAAKALLQEAGIGRGTEAVSAAIKHRQEMAERQRYSPHIT